MKRILGIIMMMTLCPALHAQIELIKTWDYPQGKANPELAAAGMALQIKKVEFKPEETTVVMEVWNAVPDRHFQFAPTAHLKANGKNYKLIGADGIVPGIWHTLPPTCHDEYTFHFEPMSSNTIRFDFIGDEDSGRAPFIINDVMASGSHIEGDWRDEATGQWLLGLYSDYLIYDNKVWKITSCDFLNGVFNISDPEGISSLKLNFGKEKSGQRTLCITDGNGKKLHKTVSRIQGLFLPDYPKDDTLTSFIDNNYQEGDSVTISGYIRNIPKDNGINEVSVSYRSLFHNEFERFSAPVDSLGMFTLRFPVPNTQAALFSIQDSDIELPFEPGQTYFYSIDLATGRRLWMGERSRILNELSAHPAVLNPPHELDGSGEKLVSNYEGYLNKVNSLIKEILTQSPTLSPLWSKWIRENALALCAGVAGQSRYENIMAVFSEPVRKFVHEKIFANLPANPSACTAYMWSTFFQDMINESWHSSPYVLMVPMSLKSPGAMMLQFSPDNFEKFRPEVEKLRMEIDSLRNAGDLDVLPEELMNRCYACLKEAQDIETDDYETTKLKILLVTLDSLKLPASYRDMILSLSASFLIDHNRTALPDAYLSLINDLMKLPVARNTVLKLNDKYTQLAKQNVNQENTSMIAPETLSELNSGQEIMNKMLAPFRGHPVLIDVWGTWCRPCKEALKNFDGLRKDLAPYDMIYIFLANNSPEQGWKNVINEYGLTGENIIHYNLPPEKQSLIESYLKVQGYPSYRLFNADGELMDVDVDPRKGTLPEILKKLHKD